MKNQMYLKEWSKLIKAEQKYISKISNRKKGKLENLLDDKIPDKLQETLNVAFSKSLQLVFEKGTSVIEKSYNKDEMQMKYKVNDYALSLKEDKKRLNIFKKEANGSKNKNVLLSGVKGAGLGILGIGLPDIPIFIGVMLKGIYEISIQYGFDYTEKKEQFFILKLISTALAQDEDFINGNEEINKFIKDPMYANNFNYIEEIERASDQLSTELLCMKFLQGLPIIGVVGGVADAVFIDRILKYAQMKYNRRFLSDKIGVQ